MPALAERAQRTNKNTLSALERLTCEGVVDGLSQSKSYRLARRNLKLSEQKDTSINTNASYLINQPKCQEYIAKLREAQFTGKALSLAEKRAFLAGAVRTPLSDIDASSVYCQEKTTSVGKDGQEVIKLKVVNKLQAIEIDNKMAGHNFGDSDDVSANPFAMIVNFTQNNVTMTGQPGQERVIEAEVISEDI